MSEPHKVSEPSGWLCVTCNRAWPQGQEYCSSCGMGKYNKENNYGCPLEVVESIQRYVVNKVEPGSFVMAVLTNSLCQAVFNSDMTNIEKLKAICMYMYWKIPGNCWGSTEKVKKWLEGGK